MHENLDQNAFPSRYWTIGMNEVVEAGHGVRQASFVAFLEGPTAHPDGTLYFSDIAANRIMKMSDEGVTSVYREDSGRANGNVLDLAGNLITCEGAEHGPGGRRRMTRTDLQTGEVTVLTDRFEGKRYNSPNDVVIDEHGRIYFTDPRYGDRSDMELDVEGVYRIDPDGTVSRILSQPQIERPNGLAISPDGKILYIIDSNHFADGNRKIWAFDLSDDGEASNPRVIHDFAPGRGGDGMEVDVDGNLYVCAGIVTPRSEHETNDVPPGVYIFDPEGTLLGRIPIPQDVISNCCFGGADLRTLYVTAGTSVYETRVVRQGFHACPSLNY